MSAPLVHPVQASVDLPLDDYGRALISYSGSGTVDWEDGSSRALAFNAAQFPDGRIVILGHYGSDNPFSWFGGGDEPEPISFSGVTPEGWTLHSEGNARSTNYLPKMTVEGSYAALRLNQLECSRAMTSVVTDHRFGLVTSFRERSGVPSAARRQCPTTGLPVTLSMGDRTIAGMIVAVEDADHLHRRGLTHKSAEVLAELVVPKTDGVEGADLVSAVSDLGVALSVMRGTKVVWIYRHDYSGNQIVHTTHRASIVRRIRRGPRRGDFEHRAASATFVKKQWSIVHRRC
jgi:hypothetical protein